MPLLHLEDCETKMKREDKERIRLNILKLADDVLNKKITMKEAEAEIWKEIKKLEKKEAAYEELKV